MLNPNNLKLLVIMLSVISFFPQLHCLYRHRSYEGLLLFYVLLNFLVATEQLSRGLDLIAVSNKVSLGVAHDPPSLGDWLKVCQLLVVWFCHALLFFACMRFPPVRPQLKQSLCLTYFAFFMISIVPVLIGANLPQEGSRSSPAKDRRWFSVFLWIGHAMFINPAITLCGLASLGYQAAEIRSRVSLGALSLLGPACQAVVFALVGVSWIFRLTIGEDQYRGETGLMAFAWWYWQVGWAAVDSLMFALVQGVLVFVARRKRSKLTNERDEATDEETAPLLH